MEDDARQPERNEGGGDRVDEALCDAERGLGPFLPTGVAFSGAKSAQNAQNFPRPGALPPDPRQHTVLLPMRVARGGGETWAQWTWYMRPGDSRAARKKFWGLFQGHHCH